MNKKKLFFGLMILLGVVIYSCEKEIPDPPITKQNGSSSSSSGGSSTSSGSSSSSTSSGGGCDYSQSYSTITCNDPGYYPVTQSTCCSSSFPYYCPETGFCYATACAAESDCSGGSTPIRANLSGSSSSSSSSSSGSSSGSNTGELMVYNKNSQPCPAGAGSTISVYIDGSYVGGLSSYFSGTPDCNQSGTITRTLSIGSHSVRGECGTTTWGPSTVTVYADDCTKFYFY